MRNTDIEKLLGKYDNGEISEEELQTLSSMTHRDDVMMSAMTMATKIRKRRRSMVLSVVSVLVMVCGVGLFMRPMWMEDEKLDIAMVADESIPIPVETISVNPSEQVVKNPSANAVEEMKVNARKCAVYESTPVEVAQQIEEVQLNNTENVAVEEVVNVEECQIIDDAEVMHTEDDKYSTETQVLCNVECDENEVINEVWDFLRT